mgnify:CR=1 FL=1
MTAGKITTKDSEANINKTILYKTLTRMINNKTKVTHNKINGYIIYKNGFYIFQPNDMYNVKAPLIYRDKYYSNRVKDFKLKLDDLSSIKDNSNNNSDKYTKLINSYVKMYNDIETIFNKIYVSNKKNLYMKNIILDIIFNKIKSTDLVKLFNIIYNNELEINNVICNKISELINKKDINIKYNGYIIIKKNNRYILKYYNSKNKDISLISGLVNVKLNKFKIVDKTKDKDIITKDKKTSKRTQQTGRECLTYEIKVLTNIINILLNKSNIFNINNILPRKKTLCVAIEIILRYYNVIKLNKKVWLLYE